jgi:multisubunit Na+/H+ antiporter MnhB subunit
VTSRFASNLIALLVGAFVMSVRFVFGPASIPWLGFAGGCAIFASTLLLFLARGRGPLQRGLDLAIAAAAGWLIIAALVYPVSTAGWMALAAGGACALLGLAGLIAHEAVTERAVARAADRPAPSADREPASGGPTPLARRAWPS